MLHIILIEPEIPPNTGNIARLCLATRTRLHLVGRLGFSIDDKTLRRAGMDYWQECDIKTWPDLETCLGAEAGGNLHLFTTKAGKTLWETRFQDGDFLIFGRETKGLPESLLAKYPESCVRIPMSREARSLNLATSAGIGLYEALRQTGLAASGSF